MAAFQPDYIGSCRSPRFFTVACLVIQYRERLPVALYKPRKPSSGNPTPYYRGKRHP